MPDCLAAALELLDRGFSVIPVGRDKRPLLAWKEFQARRATPEEAEAWWSRWPDANLGVVTGAVSGLVVADADGPAGEAWIREHLPPTAIYCRTGGGGLHAYYRLPVGREAANRVRLAPEVDVRGEGGYVVAPPSLHASGRLYAWEMPAGFEGWEDLADWPALDIPRPALQVLPGGGEGGGGGGGVRGNLALDLSRVKDPIESKDVAQGGRNNALARQVGRWIALGMDQDEALDAAWGWNLRRCRPPLGEKELGRTVTSVFRRHQLNHPDPAEGLKVEVPPATPAAPEDGLPRDIPSPGGLLGAIMDYIDESSATSCRLFNLAAAITCLGAVAGQKVSTSTGSRTNFYTICLGYSGAGKDAPHTALPLLLARTSAAGVIGPNSVTSASAILKWMGKGDGSRGNTLLLLDEVGLLFRGARNQAASEASIPGVLLTLWSGTNRPYIKGFAGQDPFHLHWHHLSLYGSSTPRRWWEALTSGEAMDGFLARMLVFESRHDIPLPAERDLLIEPPADLVRALSAIHDLPVPRTGGNLQMGGVPVPYVVPYAPPAEALRQEALRHYIGLQNRHKEEEDGASAIYGRMAEQAGKLALVHALSRLGAEVIQAEITRDDLEWAFGLAAPLAEHVIAAVRVNVADDPFQLLCNRAVEVIRKARTPDRPGATARAIYRALRQPKRVVEDVLESLSRAGVIKQEPVGDGGRGRPSLLYCLAVEATDC